MAKHLKYYGEFLSHDGHTVRCEILQESTTEFTPVEVCFSLPSPLVIEWAETDKIKPIQGSTATLVLNSDSDRQFIDFGEEVSMDTVRLDVYRDRSLYWSGCLDPETYEEPYTCAKDYDVTLTFSDFGALNRIRWSRTGIESFNTILYAALSATGIHYNSLITYIDIRKEGGYAANLNTDVELNNENFYDEEGIPLTAYEVLEGILQPFAFRIIQRGGLLVLYDLNTLYSRSATQIEWTDTDAVLSKDVAYNNASVKFSPYADADVLVGSVNVTQRSGNGVTVKTSYNPDSGQTIDGFVLRQGTEVTANGVTIDYSGVKFFDIVSQYSGSDASGVLWGYEKGDSALEDGDTQHVGYYPGSPYVVRDGQGTLAFAGRKIFTTPAKWLNKVSSSDRFRLRISLDFLFDVRYNPFEEAGDYNEKKNFKLMEKCRFAYVPVMVTLRNSSGQAICHLENNNLVQSEYLQTSRHLTRWVSGEGTPGCCWLAYYDWDDRKGKTGLGGWATNKRTIGHYYGDIPESWIKMGDGEYVTLPSVNQGYLEMSVYSGVHIYGRTGLLTEGRYTEIYDYVRWMAYKDASITLVHKNGQSVDMEDQEDVAHINPAAYEEYSLDTIIGTLSPKLLSVTGRGLIFNGSATHTKFQRAGVTDRLEKLLLGTIYSQYAERHNKLSGRVSLLSAVGPYSDAAISGKYLVASDSQDLVADESDMTIVEFVQDNYEGIDYE